MTLTLRTSATAPFAGAGRRQRRSGGRLRDMELHTSGLTRTTVIRLALSPCGGSAQLQRETREPRRGAEIESNSAHSSRALERMWKECEATAPRGTTVSTARRTRRGLDSRQLIDSCRSPGRRPALLRSCGPAARRGSTGVEGDAVSRGDAVLEEVVEQLLQLLGRHRRVVHAARAG